MRDITRSRGRLTVRGGIDMYGMYPIGGMEWHEGTIAFPEVTRRVPWFRPPDFLHQLR
jgi:hypothetical protein